MGMVQATVGNRAGLLKAFANPGIGFLQSSAFMTASFDSLLFLICFDDDEDIACPYCQAALVVTSEQGKSGREQVRCGECAGDFLGDWDEGRVHYGG